MSDAMTAKNRMIAAGPLAGRTSFAMFGLVHFGHMVAVVWLREIQLECQCSASSRFRTQIKHVFSVRNCEYIDQ